MNRATNVTIDAETYYTIRTLLITAKMAVSDNRPMYVWQPWEIQDLIDSLNNDAHFIFREVNA